MMRILYITDGAPGGISSHVRCLTQCLKGVAEIMVCITQREDALRQMLDEDGTPYHLCNCKSGHDLRLFFAVRRIVREFKPDVIHLHDYRLFGALYLRYFTKIPRVCSIHLPSNPTPRFSRRMVNWAVQPCYWLPVSKANWDRFSAYHPGVKGEVFFNPVKIKSPIPNPQPATPNPQLPTHNFPIVGMVGRNADQKDWPSFHAVMAQVRKTRQVEVWNLGEKEFCPNAAERIAQMDLFLMTSKHEELPTTVLECFMARTPICGFIPRGGMHDILALSNGALREVFVEERSVERLAEIVLRVLGDAALRERLVEDGWQILVNHFDAEKNCRGQLMDVYRRLTGENGRNMTTQLSNCWSLPIFSERKLNSPR